MTELEPARSALTRGEYASALALLAEAERGLPEGEHALRAELWLLRAAAWRSQGQQDPAAAWAKRACDAATLHGWAGVRLSARVLLAEIESGRGDTRGAFALFDALLPELADAPELALRCELGRAQSARALGRPAHAEAGLLRGLALARELRDGAAEGVVLLNLGAVLISAGHLEAAAGRYEAAEVLCAAAGDRRSVADCVLGRAEVLRLRGDHPAAEALYRESLRLMLEIGSGQWVVPRMNLGISLSEQGRHTEAHGHLRAVLDAMSEQGRGGFVFMLRMMCLPCAAGERDWETWDRDYHAAREVLVSLADPDVARAAERSGALCDAAAELGRAARSFELALGQWTKLGCAAEAEIVRTALRSLRSRGAPIPVGGFDLETQVGSGGMGVVWRGSHRMAPVAVKVLTRDAAQRRRESIRSEVRAMAGLDHPNIALVLDCGEVGEAAEAMSDGELCAGSPYLAMELADASIEALCGQLEWARCRDILRQVLLGLGHAHARDVVHLDIKPANVLLAPDGGVLVADFGIARAFSDASGTGVAGTPAYMAPEQHLGRSREFGPWTDLYAVGCLALTLVQGRAPFDDLPRVAGRTAVPTDDTGTWVEVSEFPSDPEGSTGMLLRQAHLWREPTIDPRIEVPAGFFPWVRRLLEKAPADRFRQAADAIEALDAMEPGAARIPADWRTPPRPRRGAALVGAGLGLYGVRTVPFVGREPERERMWAALSALRDEGRPRALLLHGPPGFGRSRTARWLAVRAHEAGFARWVRVSGGADTLVRIARALVRADGLEENEIVARIEAEWGEPAFRFGALCVGEPLDTAERHALLTALLERTARARPVIVVIDDAHEDVDALAWTAGMLTSTARALIVVTARDDILAEHPRAARAWERLAAVPEALAIPIGPLSPPDRRALLRELLGLGQGLAARVEARTAGNPLFAVQLVGDWVQRGLLSPGSGGFELRAGPEPPLPDGLHDVWTARVGRVLEGLSAGARDALEIAAVLGGSGQSREVETTEWAAACAAEGVDPGSELFLRLVANRLVRGTATGWAFEHQMLRESLERMAMEGGRLAQHNRACAAIVSPDEPGRVGRLLVGAGDSLAALGPLLAGARAAVVGGGEPEAVLLLDLVDDALRVGAVPEADPIRGEAMVLRMLAIGGLGRLEDAEGLGERVIGAARRHHWTALLPEALRVHARTLRSRAEWARAEVCFREAITLFEAGGDGIGTARSRHGLGLLLRRRGDLAGASRAFEEAIAGFAASAEPERMHACLYSLGAVYQESGDFERALAVYHDLRTRHETVGNRLGMADAIVGTAEIARRRGDLDAAETSYREAIELLHAHGPLHRLAPEINLALVLLARDRIDEARAALDELLRRAGNGPRTYLAIVCVAMLAAEAAGPEEAWAAAWRAVEVEVSGTAEAHSDIAWCADLAGERAAAAGYSTRAGLAWELAWDQWTRLGRADEARRVEARRAR